MRSSGLGSIVRDRWSLQMIKYIYVAGVAQLVEHLICNQRVGGSNPSASSIPSITSVLSTLTLPIQDPPLTQTVREFPLATKSARASKSVRENLAQAHAPRVSPRQELPVGNASASLLLLAQVYEIPDGRSAA